MHRIVDVEPDLRLIAAAISQPARCAMLQALMGAVSLPASELAFRAGVSNSTASSHLNVLVESGAVAVCKCGRHRYYKLSSPDVAQFLEQLSYSAPARDVPKAPRKSVGDKLRKARFCYDHLAGELGVAITDAMIAEGCISEDGEAFGLTRSGEDFLKSRLQIEPDALRRMRRPIVLSCLDWSERRPHAAGAVGSALASCFMNSGWIVGSRDDWSVAVTPTGAEMFKALFGLEFPVSS